MHHNLDANSTYPRKNFFLINIFILEQNMSKKKVFSSSFCDLQIFSCYDPIIQWIQKK